MFYRGTQENKTINYFAHIRKEKKKFIIMLL